jgi:hypothetical protein
MVVAAQSFDDLLGTAAAALVPQGGEFLCLALTGKDGIDNPRKENGRTFPAPLCKAFDGGSLEWLILIRFQT